MSNSGIFGLSSFLQTFVLSKYAKNKKNASTSHPSGTPWLIRGWGQQRNSVQTFEVSE